jgi:hypothetical protein
MRYSENQLNDLVSNDPKELARILISPDVDVRTLTYGVEILGGEVSDEELTCPVFRKLLRHMNASVREGAINGVAAFFSNKKPPRDILDRLKAISISDPSPNNKECAKTLLDNLESQ